MKSRIGVLYAMRKEAGRLLPGRPSIRHGDVEFWTLLGGDLVIAVGGIGKVNAAMATQALIDVYDPGIVINAGICGCLEPGNVGKVYLVNDLVQHDVNTAAAGDQPGFVSTVRKIWFESTGMKRMRKAMAATWPPEEYSVANIATGDWFAEAGGRLDWIKLVFKPHLIDMEAAAVAQVCLRNDVDFLAVKAVSDTVADGTDSEYDDEESCMAAITSLTYAVMDIIEHIRQEDKQK